MKEIERLKSTSCNLVAWALGHSSINDILGDRIVQESKCIKPKKETI